MHSPPIKSSLAVNQHFQHFFDTSLKPSSNFQIVFDSFNLFLQRAHQFFALTF
jgi:hypothetical protein